MVGRRAGLRSLFLIAPIAAPASAQAVWVIPAAAVAVAAVAGKKGL